MRTVGAALFGLGAVLGVYMDIRWMTQERRRALLKGVEENRAESNGALQLCQDQNQPRAEVLCLRRRVRTKDTHGMASRD